jgi:peroxiredoxin
MPTNILTPGEPAPDFELTDVKGNPIRLSNYRGQKPVVLAFLRGFM